MKFVAFTLLASLISFNASAAGLNLVCMTGNAADMDIKIEQLENNKEKISVTLTGMDGNTTRTYVNSGFENNGLTKRLATGKDFNVMVSKSDLKDNRGGAYLGAGILVMENDKANRAFNVLVSVEDNIYTGICR